MSCPLSVVNVAVGVVVVMCGQSSKTKSDHGSVIPCATCTYIFEIAAMFLIFHMPPAPTWFSLEPSYLAQLCMYIGAKHTGKIILLCMVNVLKV